MTDGHNNYPAGVGDSALDPPPESPEVELTVWLLDDELDVLRRYRHLNAALVHKLAKDIVAKVYQQIID